MKKNFILSMVFALLFSTLALSIGDSSASAATMKPVPGSAGWKYRVEGPHVEGTDNDWHVHVEKGKIKGAERVNGGKSHKKTLDSAGVPKSVQKNVKKTADFKKGLEKQKKLDKERQKVSKYSLPQLVKNPSLVVTMAAVIGITVSNLLRHPSLIFG
ncbi:hypothetical protein [Priestia megaterium]|uniref:hypothetical protein n=1 Tax=Priestia megaterium TaxID=1404 RepID=UPI00047154A3|nr:hypothetical protein [Priestia megaterium]PFA95899.1 hypothetical protein CN383_26065 [Priestia megaterium]